jgi:hypothetical protein
MTTLLFLSIIESNLGSLQNTSKWKIAPSGNFTLNLNSENFPHFESERLEWEKIMPLFPRRYFSPLSSWLLAPSSTVY